jgi:hypothetical protein
MTQGTLEHQRNDGIHIETVVDHLDRLENFPAEIGEYLRQQPVETLVFRPSADTWSIVEILGHLIVFDARWGNRMRQMLSADAVRFVAMEAEYAVQRFGFQNKQAGDLLGGFTARRAEMVVFLRGLRTAHLMRTGSHPVKGTISVVDAIATLVDNDAIRGCQIRTNLRAYHEAQ